MLPTLPSFFLRAHPRLVRLPAHALQLPRVLNISLSKAYASSQAKPGANSKEEIAPSPANSSSTLGVPTPRLTDV